LVRSEFLEPAPYNAPVAAVLFVVEIVTGVVVLEAIVPMLVAVVIATIATRYVAGDTPLYGERAFVLGSPVELVASPAWASPSRRSASGSCGCSGSPIGSGARSRCRGGPRWVASGAARSSTRCRWWPAMASSRARRCSMTTSRASW
jgi:hypothetical protein